MTAPTRPVLHWHGGKKKQAKRIIKYFPPHRRYVEPYGGAASVLLAKPRVYAEVYNDLDNTLVSLFRVLRDLPMAAELIRQLELTPFARAEFNQAYEPTDDPIERARRTIARSFMGFGSDSTAGHYRTGFRSNTTHQGTTPARDWMRYPDGLRAIVERFQGVVIEQKPAIDVMRKYDGEDTLLYLDPPYLPETRTQDNRRRRCGPGCAPSTVYTHELTQADHVELLDAARALRGMVILSGYPSSLYDQALPDWRRVEAQALADGARKRTEVLWINLSATERLAPGPLFVEAA